ncbi:hypothetical protein GOV13_03455 [Candidatus Pacearchaeota archaeon]|nr:hypothetical protein [Candidatus Pacearchaeota archaeon]
MTSEKVVFNLSIIIFLFITYLVCFGIFVNKNILLFLFCFTYLIFFFVSDFIYQIKKVNKSLKPCSKEVRIYW